MSTHLQHLALISAQLLTRLEILHPRRFIRFSMRSGEPFSDSRPKRASFVAREAKDESVFTKRTESSERCYRIRWYPRVIDWSQLLEAVSSPRHLESPLAPNDDRNSFKTSTSPPRPALVSRDKPSLTSSRKCRCPPISLSIDSRGGPAIKAPQSRSPPPRTQLVSIVVVVVVVR